METRRLKWNPTKIQQKNVALLIGFEIQEYAVLFFVQFAHFRMTMEHTVFFTRSNAFAPGPIL